MHVNLKNYYISHPEIWNKLNNFNLLEIKRILIKFNCLIPISLKFDVSARTIFPEIWVNDK
jgi:hypothetical protein